MLAIVVVAAGAPWRLFIPEAITLGIAQADTLFHVAIAQIAAQFSIPSTGGDGLTLQHYHFGSHLAAAGLSAASDSSAALIYVYWGAVLLKVQALWAFWLAATMMGKQRTLLLPSIAYATLFLLLCPLESESFMLAIAVFVGAVPLICTMISRDDQKTNAFRSGLPTVLLAAIACAAAKVSVGYFVGASLALMAWRRRGNLADVMLLAVGAVILGLITVSFVLPFEQSLAETGLRVLLASYAQYATMTALMSYLLPAFVVWACVAGLGVKATRVGGDDGEQTQLHIHYISDTAHSSWFQRLMRADGLVQLHALCLAACLLVLVTVPIGAGMFYFSYVLLILPALISPTWLSAACAPGSGGRRILIVTATLCCVYLSGGFAFTLVNTIGSITHGAQQLTAPEYRNAHDGDGLSKLVIADSLRQSGTPFGTLRLQVQNTQWAELLRSLRQASAGSMQVFVPPAVEDFWTRLKVGGTNPYWCMQPHLMIPSQTGIPMIFGIAPLKYETGCSPFAGLYGFGKHQDMHRTRELSDEQLCEIARNRSVDAVYVLDSVEPPERNRILRCGA